jgi:tetratricopeptide (TPR) repeat protein
MVDDKRVDQLLEQLLDSGGTPEEVCRSCPELLAPVRSGWQQLRALQAEVSAWFPESTSAAGVDARRIRPAGEPTSDLPHVNGYEVQEKLGRGGMGIVYKAQHLRLNRPVALKMLLAGDCAQPQELERFLREAETVAGLHHPNIVQVHEAGDLGGRPYFTMEFIEGGSLAQKLAGMPQPARQAAALVALVAEAVHAAHLRGVVHRDLKPGNILLTADGTPKLTDFGLARRLEGTAGLTQSGMPVGTPSYMAPEQAQGKASGVGPATDIYALGAVLYELLTGRPPFRATTGAETLQQVVSENPVTPTRLNPTAPRDLETICLKCLEKEPSRRYPSAWAVAEDLHRFQRNEPILARPVGSLERVLRWTRRKPTAAALAATALAMLALMITSGVWLVQRRAELRNEVSTALTQAFRLRKQFHFREARALLEQARQQLVPVGPDDLRRQVDGALDDLELVENLDKARLGGATPVEGRWFDRTAALPLYEKALAQIGVGRPGDDVKAILARVRNSAVRADIVAALDDWASITADPVRRAWLLTLARGADPDPTRDRLRQPELWKDGPTLAKVVREMRVDELSPQLATALGRVLRETGEEAMPLLLASQARNPQDFWLNFELGWELYDSQRFNEALSFNRAALALRPESSPAYNSVGTTLISMSFVDQGTLALRPQASPAYYSDGISPIRMDLVDEGISYYRQALKIEPTFVISHNNLGFALYLKGRRDEAVGQFLEALRLDPTSAPAHSGLATVLWAKGKEEEAFRHLREAIRLDPKGSAQAHNNLGCALRDTGRLDEAIRHFEQAIQLRPKFSAFAHRNLGLALVKKARLDEAIGHFEQAIQLHPDFFRARSDLCNCLYVAARVALQTSTGKSVQKTPPGEQERARLRQQGLERLRASLKLRTNLPDDKKPGAGWSLAAWQTDPALANVREPAGLAKLPEAEREQWQHLWTDVAAELAADPVENGKAHAARRDWAKAAACYTRRLVGGRTEDGHLWFEYAAFLLLSGDHADYAKACASMVGSCGKASGLRPYHVARASTLAPDAVADSSLPGRLAKTELMAAAGQFWSLTEQGALSYRAGRFEQALGLFEKSLSADSKPGRAVLNWLWLALANRRLGKFEEARGWLNKANAWLDQFRDGMPKDAGQKFGLDMHNWLEAHVLQREAEALIQPAPSR